MAQTKEGAEKIAAGFCGIPADEYRRRRAAGFKRCTKCKEWIPVRLFNSDISRNDGLAAACRECQNKTGRDRYTPVPDDKRKPHGPAPIAPRNGDKIQARMTANRLKNIGCLRDPNETPCKECGHRGADRRHEFHHHNGYEAEHHADVVVLCSKCHAQEHTKTHCIKGHVRDGVRPNGTRFCKTCNRQWDKQRKHPAGYWTEVNKRQKERNAKAGK